MTSGCVIRRRRSPITIFSDCLPLMVPPRFAKGASSIRGLNLLQRGQITASQCRFATEKGAMAWPMYPSTFLSEWPVVFSVLGRARTSSCQARDSHSLRSKSSPRPARFRRRNIINSRSATTPVRANPFFFASSGTRFFNALGAKWKSGWRV